MNNHTRETITGAIAVSQHRRLSRELLQQSMEPRQPRVQVNALLRSKVCLQAAEGQAETGPAALRSTVGNFQRTGYGKSRPHVKPITYYCMRQCTASATH